jgi:hypothetical protein
MSNIQPATLTATAGFVDLVLADQQLVDLEFAAIIAAAWPDPRQPTDPLPPHAYRAPQHNHGGRGPGRTITGDQLVRLGTEAWRRERSPPASGSTLQEEGKEGDGYRR